MEDSSVSAIYRSVIDTVIERVKPDFVQEGVDESVLDELRLKWEKKLKDSGALEPEPAPAPPRYQQKLQQPTRQMPPLPAFLSNLTAQQPAAPNSYAIAGSPAQYLQPRQPQGAITTPQLPVMTGVPLGAPPVSVALPSDRLHPHLLSNTGPNPQQQYQRAYYAPPANTYTAPPQQQPQHAGASSSSAMPNLALYQQQQQPQAAQQRYQQQGTAQGTAQLQQQHLPRQQQPHSQQHLNGAQQPRQQPNLQSLLSIQGGYSAPPPDSRKRKAEDEHSALFSLLPDSTPSVPGSSAPSIPQQDGPGDDVDDKDEAADDEKAEEEEDKGETFSDVSSEPEEEDDQQIANIVVGQFEKVARSRQKWKVHLKDGVMRINGKDHLFHTAVGDMLF